MNTNVSKKPKQCAYCGKMFIPKSNRQKYCGEDYGNCPVCGKLVKIKDMKIGPQTCSMECRQVLIEQTNLEKYGVKNTFQSEKTKEKSKETCLEKYGTERYQSTSEYREKYIKTMNDRYGVDAPLQSDVIKNKSVETNLKNNGVPYPSQNKEIQEKIKKSFEDNHGGRGFGSDEISSKIQDTMIKTYGVDNAFKSDDIRNKAKQTNIQTYGVEHPMQNESVKQKAMDTNNVLYGGNSPFSSQEVRNRAVHTNQKTYGVDNVFQSDEIKDRIKKTNLKRYDVENPMQNPDIKQKVRNTNMKKYGAESWMKSDLKQTIIDPSKIDIFKKFKINSKEFIQNNFTEKPTLQQVADLTGVAVSTICVYVINQNCENMISYHLSNMELELRDFILSLIPDAEIIMHDRKIIEPMEVDIYLPEYDFAIECNPTYTHNSTQPAFNRPKPMPMTYHRNKSMECWNKGIFLFHIFGYEWNDKKEIIKSMIRNILGKNENIIYGRNTVVKEISQPEMDIFLNQNHRQGTTNAKIRLGLFDKSIDELVSVMSFGHLRNSVGMTVTTDKNDVELSRFCGKINTTVVGGASKLFKYFTENYEFDKIISFSDVAHTRGNMYKILGFEPVTFSRPNYVWVESKTGRYYNRVKCQKKNLRKLFNEPDIDIDNQTESKIMSEHGFVKVYDCGVVRWEYIEES